MGNTHVFAVLVTLIFAMILGLAFGCAPAEAAADAPVKYSGYVSCPGLYDGPASATRTGDYWLVEDIDGVTVVDGPCAITVME